MSVTDWESKTVGELVTFEGGSQPPKGTFISEPKDDYVRLIQIRDYKTNNYPTYVPRALARKFCTVDDVMIGRYGPPIFQILRGLAGAYNVALIKAVPNEKVLKDYLYYFLNQRPLFNLIDQLSRRSAGQSGVDLEALRNYEFPLPSKNEQQQVVSVLKTWDYGIEKLEQLITAKTKLKRGLMQQLLSGRMRFQEFEAKAWKRYRISALFEEINRYEEWNEEILYDLVSIRRRWGGLFYRGAQYGQQIKVKKLKSIETGDFLISKRQVVHGAWGMVKPEFSGMKVSDEYDCLIVKDPEVLDIGFFNCLSQMTFMQRYAFLACNGVHIEKLIFDYEDFSKEFISIPPTIGEQKRIAAVFDASNREIELLQKQLVVLKKQKQGLMQKLLTGQIRVKVEARS